MGGGEGGCADRESNTRRRYLNPECPRQVLTTCEGIANCQKKRISQWIGIEWGRRLLRRRRWDEDQKTRTTLWRRAYGLASRGRGVGSGRGDWRVGVRGRRPPCLSCCFHRRGRADASAGVWNSTRKCPRLPRRHPTLPSPWQD